MICIDCQRLSCEAVSSAMFGCECCATHDIAILVGEWSIEPLPTAEPITLFMTGEQ
jgi:hypothetical protein